MEITTYFKCSCGHCGQIMEYLAREAGNVVVCPQCKEKSQLPEPEKLGMLEIQGPSLPATKNCPVCGMEMKFLAADCFNCQSLQKQKLRRILSFAVASVAVLALLGVFWLVMRRSKPVESVTRTETNSVKMGTMILAQPQVKQPKSINDLKPGRFSLEQKRGSDTVMAVGDIQNASENLHLGLKVDVDLLDASGAKIGTVTDYSAQLGPRQTWHFVALVTNPKVTSVKFATIKEDQ
ncbi:MAG TPA: FxLYD domain-containing protein [Verrucomicrobiae bacterium]|nr:FxLYD domain-containing protein [Verrucomicrobiae bacterium]